MMHRIDPVLIGFLLFLSVIITGGVQFVHTVWGAIATSQLMVGNSQPIVTAVTLNNGNAITLTANATTTVPVNFTVTDYDGCSDVFSSGSLNIYVYRSGVGSSSASTTSSTLHSYVTQSVTHACSGSATSSVATATVNIWHFAQATDASSSFPSQTWMATVVARDASSSASSSDSAGVELNTLLAIDAASSTLSYGTVSAGATTTGNFPATIVNAGNSSTTLTIFGTALSHQVIPFTFIPTSSQHYATGTFTYGGLEQALAGTASPISGLTISRPPLAAWATTTPMQSGVSHHSSVVHNGFIYVVGGFTGTVATSTVRYAPINADGTLGAWATTTPMQSGLYVHSSVVHNSFIYVMGGYTTSETSTVRYAPINADGTLGAWATTTPMQSGLFAHSSVVHNGFIYVVGGQPGSTSTVRYAPINSSGTLGSWSTTTPMQDPLSYQSATVFNGNLYVMGGYTVALSATSTVRYAPINASGTLGAWATTTPMQSGLFIHASAVNNRILYVAGGDPGTSVMTSTVRYAPINSSGTLGSWSTTTPMQDTLGYHSPLIDNGYLFVTGGNTGSGVTSTVRYAPLASRNTYWGLQVPGGMPTGTYTGITTVTAVFAP